MPRCQYDALTKLGATVPERDSVRNALQTQYYNVSLTVVNNASGEDDASFFQRVLRELMLEWLPAIRRLGMTRR